jgi:hypothetical protein
MPRFAIASLLAVAFVVATTFASPSNAESSTEPHKKHAVKHQVDVARDRAAPGQYYGAPANYYPAPPFPFFLLPGPWWLPAHS